MKNINGYYLTERWFSFMAENNKIVQCKHTAVYLYIVEMFNKRQWVKRIGLPTDFTTGALSISYKTYKKVLEDLVEFGFLKIEWSKNQYSSNQVELVKIPKASSKHIPKLDESNSQSGHQSEFSINKTYKQLNKKHINTILDYFDSLPAEMLEEKLKELKHSEIKEDVSNKTPFEEFWNLYDKKVGNKDKIAEKWSKLSEADRQAIMQYVPKYKQAQPDKQYRKNPETFLNNKSWNDEIIGNVNDRKIQLNFD